MDCKGTSMKGMGIAGKVKGAPDGVSTGVLYIGNGYRFSGHDAGESRRGDR